MHFVILLLVLSLAWLLRLVWEPQTGNWTERWHKALFFFLFPPLLVLFAAIAVLCMGPQGQMIGLKTDWYSYGVVLGGVGCAIAKSIQLALQGWQSLRKIRALGELQQGSEDGYDRDRPIRILEVPQLFCARVGFWHSELVVSRGLLQTLSPEHLEAVLAHERAHYYYRDTFWFFWLGWLRQIMAWLPETEALWQELLTLRELRADRWAADRVDPLLVAEALVAVVGDTVAIADSEPFCAAFSRPFPANRLQERINALLDNPEVTPSFPWWTWSWGILVFLPLMVVPFHH